MPRFIAAAIFSMTMGFALGASASDATVPVKAVMDATVANWSGGDSDWQDIFDDAKLKQFYSKDFVAKYRAAAEFPAVDDGISPFDYDVIVGGEDACPLENLTITPQAPSSGTTEVVAQFKKSTCMGTGAEYQAFTNVRFKVVDEDGRAVIDDILTTDESGNVGSLKDVMQNIVTEQKK